MPEQVFGLDKVLSQPEHIFPLFDESIYKFKFCIDLKYFEFINFMLYFQKNNKKFKKLKAAVDLRRVLCAKNAS